MSEFICDFCYNKNKLILLKTSIKDKKRYNGCCHCWQKASLYNCLKELPAYKGIGIGNRVWVAHKNPYTDKVEKSTDGADVVATDTWVSMGDEAEKTKRIKEFQEYTIDQKLMSLAKPDAIFMHCLPAYYGYEVTKEVAHGKQSVIFDEAENRLWAQIGIMVTLNKQ